MRIAYVCFYVNDATATRDWFIQRLGFNSIAGACDSHRCIEIVNAGAVYFVLCSAWTGASPVAEWLRRHPPGVADIAFEVEDVEATIAQALSQGATLLQPLTTEQQTNGCLKWATIAAWGDLTHTLVQRSGITPLLPAFPQCLPPVVPLPSPISAIDHLVLNVPKGELEPAVTWYETVFGFQPQQRFEIQTHYSGLCSRVMLHPSGFVQLPINEPASLNSQIQEFLDVNQGSGVQHIALETVDLVDTIAQLRHAGLPLIQIPAAYYAQLRQRSGLPLADLSLEQLEAQQILVDWQDAAELSLLLQTFTQPIFEQPTFFLELIQRQVTMVNGQPKRANGFGEGNFRALFEAIEREQIQRGTLIPG